MPVRQTVALALQNVPPGPGRAAAAEMMQAALGRQDSMEALFASLAHLDGKLAALPKGVEPASLQALAAILNLNGRSPTGQGLKTAVQRSGLFLEAMLAKGGPAASLQGDLKAALLSLSRALKPWANGKPVVSGPRNPRPPPPRRDGLPRGQRSDRPVLPDASSPREAGRALGAQVEAALARLRLSQLASLPQISGQPGGGAEAQPGEWTFELPLLFGEELGMAQFRIRRDGGGDGPDAGRAWQMHFAVDFDATGGVHAKVVLRQDTIAVTLWAEREGTAETLSNMLPELGAALESRGLRVGGLACRHGAPEEPARPVGAFMDRQT
ncbi:MAG: flagellar hook-length control protein FliK [Methyloligellaceae bacterium]